MTKQEHMDRTAPTPANRLGLDYASEASRLQDFPAGIIDVHTHINGIRAAAVYKKAAELYGVTQTYSMTKLEDAERISEIMEGRIRYIAVPNYWAEEDRRYHLTDGYIKRIEQYHAIGSRICKFWVAPRSRDYAKEWGDPESMRLDAPHRIAAMECATDLGMMLMVHVADPDTWFASKYQDADFYGTKRDQYEPLEMLMDRFTQPWMAAHMGGWPEDLEFLTGLLDRHPNLHLDTSACKWMVRELSRHSRRDFLAFMERFAGRILFGSDIVSADEHLRPAEEGEHEQYVKASSEAEAFDLYASRYWALRHLFESDYQGESPIADPDLAMIDPDRYTEMDAPELAGQLLPCDVLRTLYYDAAAGLMGSLHGDEDVDAGAADRG
jgi:hypothetical protein